jgi:hypothetical protein
MGAPNAERTPVKLEQFVEIGIVRRFAPIPTLYSVCPRKGRDGARSEMIGDLGRKDSQIEIAVSPAGMTTVDESDDAARIDDHVTQGQITMRDDEILGWPIGNEARE